MRKEGDGEGVQWKEGKGKAGEGREGKKRRIRREGRDDGGQIWRRESRR